VKQAAIGPTVDKWVFMDATDVFLVQVLNVVSRDFQSDPRRHGWLSSV
jgi:hypothetical protein